MRHSEFEPTHGWRKNASLSAADGHGPESQDGLINHLDPSPNFINQYSREEAESIGKRTLGGKSI
jgi:hypothetical protein